MQLIAVRAYSICVRGLFGLFISVLLLCTMPVWAQGPDPEVTLDQLRQQVAAMQKNLANPDPDADLLAWRSNALAAQAQAQTMVGALEPQRRSVQERLAELGTPPAEKKESVDIAALRSQLDKSSNALDAQIKLAGLVTVEAAQLADQISVQRRAQFQTELGHRTASILAPAFWYELRGSYAADADHFGVLVGELLRALRTAALGVWLAMAAALALLLWSHRQAKKLLLHLATTRIPHGRLRRSLFAVVRVLLSVLVWGAVAWIVRSGLEWRADLSALPHALLVRSVGLACFGGYVVGLGRALLAADRHSWRLPALPDAVATGLAWFPLVFAVITTAGWLAERLYALVNASLATTVALNCILALVLGLSMVIAVGRGERLRRQLDRGPDADRIPPRPLWLGVLAALVWLVLVASVLALLLGYVALGGFMVRQLAWTAIVASTTYLLLMLIDDVCMGWLATNSPDNMPAGTWRMRDQAAVVVSGVGRALVALVGLTSVLSPFGDGPPELLNRAAQFSEGLAIGEVQVRPTAVFLALTVLVVGLACVRLLKRWLVEQLLPTTNLDDGMQMSTSSLFGYAGGVLVVALALSAVGIGLERVAWVASALSVGIGFGLQAVVQNFVSGLILLAERPVKVGDWVVLGTVEGDIRRINVRATEIQMSDRSTVIVPNSEFITKTVRNITHASPLGLVQIKLPMPLDTDVEQVRALMLAAFQDHGEVQANPAPSVALDGIDNGKLVFNATAYVGSPRMSYGVRSDVLFEVLKRLREAKLPLSNPSTMVLRDVPLVAEPSVEPVTPLSPASA
ncbi:MAG: mechanosensitive ion channel family protein [Ferruginibacter sp.]|nr:mechanosensitive ion channel family protein [Rhodoferax sp.]